MSRRVAEAVEIVLLDLVFRHHKAASEANEPLREQVFGLIEEIGRVYPFSYSSVFGFEEKVAS